MEPLIDSLIRDLTDNTRQGGKIRHQLADIGRNFSEIAFFRKTINENGSSSCMGANGHCFDGQTCTSALFHFKEFI